MFDIHLGSPHIALCRAIMFLSKFLIVGIECSAIKNLYTIPARMMVSTILIVGG